jgi:hypothetical protein
MSSIIPSESLDAHSTGTSSVTSSFRSAGVTPVYPIVEDSGPNSGTQFPASVFLDIDYYIWSRVRLPAPAPGGAIPAVRFLDHPHLSTSSLCAEPDPVFCLVLPWHLIGNYNPPQPVLALLSQGNVVLDVSRDYFATIHTWFPIVSKKRMDMGLPVRNAGPDLAMLFLGMKLIAVPATTTDVAECALYTIAKDFLARLERNGTASLLCLQAMVLVALYEYGHAIYPAAWMTIGSCARYSDVLGLTPGDYPILGQPVRVPIAG